MQGEWVLWFDARCSACTRALELLRQRGIEPTIRRFLEEPPTAEELAAVVARLGVPARSIARRDADEYQALRLSDRTPDEELLRAVAQHPRILERPILVGPDGAVVARPPERVLGLVPDPPGEGDPFPEPVPLPLDGTLDLHAFHPSEVGELVPEWIAASRAAGLRELRIVHGKGIGALRRSVEALLARHPLVLSYGPAGEGAGGWGATRVILR